MLQCHCVTCALNNTYRGVRIMLEKVADSARKQWKWQNYTNLMAAIPRILLHFFIHIPNMHETYPKKYRILPIFLPALSAYAYWTMSLPSNSQCLLQRRVSRVIHPVGRRLDPVENIVPGHLWPGWYFTLSNFERTDYMACTCQILLLLS